MTFECPRCHRSVTEEENEPFYGPCTSCRLDLVANYKGAGSSGVYERERVEPKMNVVPNQVATKEQIVNEAHRWSLNAR